MNDNQDDERVLVWDIFVRFAHWGIVLAFFAAYFAGNEFMTIHEYAGYTVAGLVVLRIAWGFIGSRYARFSSFVRGPGAVWAYLKGLLKGKATRHLGHNPAGAAMIVALLLSLAGTTASGMALLGQSEGRGPVAFAYSRSVEVDGASHDGDEDVMEDIHKAFMYLTLLCPTEVVHR